VVDPQRGDPADRGGGDHVGRVEAAAEPGLDHAGVGRVAGEGEEGGGGGDLEEAGAKVFARVEDFLE
jgi:hypothetical protein